MKLSRVISAAACMLLFAAGAIANTTSFWTQAGVPQFYQGEFDGTALTDEGSIVLGRKMDTVFESTEPYIWDIAADGKGFLWAGSGNKAILYKIGEQPGEVEEAAILPGSGISSVAVDKYNNVYAAVFPGGAIHVVRPGKKAEVFARVPANYVWDMKFDEKGDLYCVTGAGAGAFRIDWQGNVKTLYMSGERHFLSMFIRDGYLYTGTSPGGLILRIDISEAEKGPKDAVKNILSIMENDSEAGFDKPADKRIAVIVDLEENEAYRILPWSDGWFLVAANFDQAAPQGQPSPPVSMSRIEPLSFPLPPSPTTPQGAQPSRLYLVNDDGQTRKVLEIPDPYILSLCPLDDDRVLVATGNEGRIYTLDIKKDDATLQELPAMQVLATHRSGDRLWLSTGNPGVVFSPANGLVETGSFTSSINDASTPAVYGNLDAIMRMPPETSVSFKTRTGNTPDPNDGTWSAWSAPAGVVPMKVSSPAGRYIQFMTEMQPSPVGESPEVREVKIFYLTANQSPEILDTMIQPAPAARKPTKPQAQGNGGPPQPAVQQGGNGNGQQRKASQAPANNSYANFMVGTITASNDVSVNWIAFDPDQDELRFKLEFRRIPSIVWSVLEEEFYEAEYAWNTESVPDGRYEIRITASDENSNTAERTLSAQVITEPFIIDHSRPVVYVTEILSKNGVVEFTGIAQDATSVLADIEYSIDGLAWKKIFPEDSIFDSNTEYFEFNVELDDDDTHTMLIRATDFVGNVGSTSVVFRK
ncbi:MAG TPA: hypothetical protein PLN69_11265 [bacterium]|nr:hypothetical protein [bacterium]